MDLKGVPSYQFTLAQSSALECNATAWDAWQRRTAFNQTVYRGKRRGLLP